MLTTGPSRISHLRDGTVRTFDFDPADLGFARATLEDIRGGDAEENAQIARDLLAGTLTGPKRDVVLLTAAAALSTEADNFSAGLAAARESIDSGAAADVLARYIAKTQTFG